MTSERERQRERERESARVCVCVCVCFSPSAFRVDNFRARERERVSVCACVCWSCSPNALRPWGSWLQVSPALCQSNVSNSLEETPSWAGQGERRAHPKFLSPKNSILEVFDCSPTLEQVLHQSYYLVLFLQSQSVNSGPSFSSLFYFSSALNGKL